ncbi:InlB B-repeat-containing protein [Paenibacillus sp. 32352]|uniref:InlB B-repeat-containing protein n=1 Tax=Paenibacillus sp. 32352 TaxID=1969111 RepID=UPI0009AEBB2C|nr:InlB B-repeat-containing protein [Paenibacillus sp. 32352]
MKAGLKQYISFIMALVLCMGLMPMRSFADTPGGMSGSGTQSDPYIIMTLAQLNAVRNNLSANYKLGADINAAETAGWNDGAGWLPIPSFTGVFDGAGHVIRGLTIHRPDSMNVGLFQEIRDAGVVKNIGLEESTIVGGSYTGGLAGLNYGTVDQAYVTGTVDSPQGVIGGLVGYNASGYNDAVQPIEGKIVGSYSAATVHSSSNDSTGGLVGQNDGKITDSYATGDVSGYKYVGGLVGINVAGLIERTYASGAVSGGSLVGGLAGENQNGVINLSYATGSVGGKDSVGGLVAVTDFGEINRSYASGMVTGSGYTGGLIGSNNGGTVSYSFWDRESTGQNNACVNNDQYLASCDATSLSTAQAIAQSSYSGSLDFQNDWFMIDGSTRPFLRMEWSQTIRNTHQLQLMEMNRGANYSLAQDIIFGTTFTDGSRSDMWATSATEGKGFVPIAGRAVSPPAFTGVFDGQGHTIHGLVIRLSNRSNVGTSYAIGLFGYTVKAKIRNVGLLDGSISGFRWVGQLVGVNRSSEISNTYASGSVLGYAIVGGLVGWNDGSSILNSYAAGKVDAYNDFVGGLTGFSEKSAISTSFAVSDVKGHDYVGGLTGVNVTNSNISESFASGSVTGNVYIGGLVGTLEDNASVSFSYATGELTGSSYIGGLTGKITDTSTIQNSFWDSEATGQTGACGEITDICTATGLTSAQMKTQSFFETAGWNLTSDWTMDEGKTYPVLQKVTPDTLRDAAPPTIARANVSDDRPNTVVVTFDESVRLADVSGFTVKIDSKDAVITGFSGTGTKSLSFTLLDRINRGQVITLSYDKSLGTVVDLEGNPLHSFVDRTVDNVTPQFTVTFDSGGGSAVASVIVQSSSTIAEPTAPTKDGYVFGGWYKDSSWQSLWNFAQDTVMSSMTLYAKWTVVPAYTVMYNGNGNMLGTTPIDTGSYAQGVTVAVYGNSGGLAKVGYSFAGWNTAADGTGTNYAPGSKFTMGAASVTLYAKWTAVPTYTVTYNGNGNTLGTTPIDTGSYAQGVTVAVYGNSGGLAKVGYSFAGWNTGADGTGTNYAPGSKFTMGAANVTLYANWTTNPEPSGNANLTALTLSSGTLTPVFSSDALTYSANVTSTVSSITVTATVYDSDSTVTASVYNSAGTLVLGPLSLTSETPSPLLPVNIGNNLIKLIVTAPNGTMRTYTVTVMRDAGPSSSSDSSNDGSNSGGTIDLVKPSVVPAGGFSIVMNGKELERAATSEESEKSKFTITLDSAKLMTQLESAGEKPVLAILVTTNADQVSAALTGDLLKALANKQGVLEFKTPIGSYKLPVAELAIDDLLKQLGEGASPATAVIHVNIAKADSTQLELAKHAADQDRFTIFAPLVDFTITASFGGKTASADTFGAYVEREIPLPDGVDPSKVTTAVVLNEDGTVRHVPTSIITRGGSYYAVVHSLTNSVYTLIGHAVKFMDVEGHWSKDIVGDLASRMIVNGVSSNNFNPNAPITRAEFAAIVVRALGLADNGKTTSFSDVPSGSWYIGAVAKAQEFGIVSGYGDGTFRGAKTITREEAMVMISRAMNLAGLDTSISDPDADAALVRFTDGASVHNWAKASVAVAVRSQLVNGSDAGLLPASDITRAETAAIIQRMLVKAGLIGNTISG